MNKVSAYLFFNGNAMFFNENGEQIPKFQKHGLCGLHDFVEFYPDAPIYWVAYEWGKEEIPKKSVPWLLRHIRKWPGPKPKAEGEEE